MSTIRSTTYQSALVLAGAAVWGAVTVTAAMQTTWHPVFAQSAFSRAFDILGAFALLNTGLILLRMFRLQSIISAILALACAVGYLAIEYLGITVSPDLFYMEWVAQLGALALVSVAYAEYAERQ